MLAGSLWPKRCWKHSVFDPTQVPRVFGLAPGIDFPRAVLDGFEKRLAGAAPEDWARVTLIVNTRRMARRIRAIFDAGPPRLLPRILLLSDVDEMMPGIMKPPGVSLLRRRLELVQLISALLDKYPELAPRTSLYDLADSLAELIDEMQGEGVSPEQIAKLDVDDVSGHWANTKQFIEIAQSYLDLTIDRPDTEARQRWVVSQITRRWDKDPHPHPVLLIGSTGSRGTTQMLMQAVANLPKGALILPGYDFDMPENVWDGLKDALTAEDHPQYRFANLINNLGSRHGDVLPWTEDPPPNSRRNKLVSLSLRRAPVTHAWRSEGPKLSDHDIATKDVTLVLAETPRAESMAIAMRLRHAVEMGQKAALITPDRMLTRQVETALDRWRIRPDDSAGLPLHLSPAGRFLRHVASIFVRGLEAESLLTLLKHPLTHSGADRNLHQLNSQRLELRMRRDGLPYPDREGIIQTARKAVGQDEDGMQRWAEWIADTLCDLKVPDARPLSYWVSLHLKVAQAMSDGVSSEPGTLWTREAGEKARAVMDALSREAGHGGAMVAADYASLVGSLLQKEEVRDATAPHPDVMIWGTLEARVQGADLVILGGLNDGTWPEAPKPDPWLNRQMRKKAGLLLPERRIGLSAHDYQQAIAAPEVWLTRSIRSDDAETVPSRWLNRLQNLMNGLETQGGKSAWDDMVKRGDAWLQRVDAMEAVEPIQKTQRPSPRPPAEVRPRILSVTEIKTLIRDPYAIYAKHCLRLRPLNPLVPTPSALERGIVSHSALEKFIKATLSHPERLTKEAFVKIAHRTLEVDVPWPAARALWLAKLMRVADWFVDGEILRQSKTRPIAFEEDAKGELVLKSINVTLRGMADRIDLTEAGEAIIYDYKTGAPPSVSQQRYFDKQLLIEAAMVEEGAFRKVGLRPVERAAFIGIGTSPKVVEAPIGDTPAPELLEQLSGLIGSYLDQAQGFSSRRAIEREALVGAYDQLARHGEWDATQDPVPRDVGR